MRFMSLQAFSQQEFLQYNNCFEIIQAGWRIYMSLSQASLVWIIDHRKAIIVANADLFLIGRRGSNAFENIVCQTSAT